MKDQLVNPVLIIWLPRQSFLYDAVWKIFLKKPCRAQVYKFKIKINLPGHKDICIVRFVINRSDSYVCYILLPTSQNHLFKYFEYGFKPLDILWATAQSEALYSQAQGFHYVQNAFEKCDIHDDLTLSRSLGSLLHFGWQCGLWVCAMGDSAHSSLSLASLQILWTFLQLLT